MLTLKIDNINIEQVKEFNSMALGFQTNRIIKRQKKL